MSKARIFAIVLFVCLIATPIVWKRVLAHQQIVKGSDREAAAMARYGFYMTQSATAAGVHFEHKEPTLDPKLKRIMPMVANMGAAVSVVDFNRDGWPDFYVTNSRIGSQNALYENMHNGTFHNVALQVGLANVNQPGTGVSMGAVWGDYDNDGWPDVLIYKWGKPVLYHNGHGRHFTIDTNADLPTWVNANTAIWFDYDNDGKLDFFLGGYYPEKFDLWRLKTTKIMPNAFEYADNGGRKYLFHNLGNGHFEEVSAQMGIQTRRWSLAAVAADFTGSGYPDLFIANDYGVSELYLNEHGKHFQEAGKKSGVGYAPKSGMTASVGDIFNQGRFSIFVTNISQRGVLVQGNNLWIPKPGISGKEIKFENAANAMGVDLGGWAFGAQFGDLNNDGYLDIYQVNGDVSLDPNRSYWYDFSKIAGGNHEIISDAANWPAVNGRSLSGYQQKHVWMNDGAGQFKEVSQLVGVTDRYDGRSVALADFDNNGALDAVVANQDGPVLLYMNHADPRNKWIEFSLQGRKSNRSAIGAEVRVFWDGQEQLQEVSGGSGFCSENQRRLHFGLGRAAHVDKVEIRWPSGRKQTIYPSQLDRVYSIEEPE